MTAKKWKLLYLEFGNTCWILWIADGLAEFKSICKAGSVEGNSNMKVKGSKSRIDLRASSTSSDWPAIETYVAVYKQ